jgi:pimeloyl-ACP methyl ester carboxylesterase
MGTITTSDGTEIFYKDWGSGQPIVFSHGWPLSSDDRDAQMLLSCITASRSSPTTGVDVDVPPRPPTGTTWTATPTTWRRSLSISTSTIPFTSDTHQPQSESAVAKEVLP